MGTYVCLLLLLLHTQGRKPVHSHRNTPVSVTLKKWSQIFWTRSLLQKDLEFWSKPTSPYLLFFRPSCVIHIIISWVFMFMQTSWMFTVMETNYSYKFWPFCLCSHYVLNCKMCFSSINIFSINITLCCCKLLVLTILFLVFC